MGSHTPTHAAPRQIRAQSGPSFTLPSLCPTQPALSVPFPHPALQTAGAVFTLDTAKETLVLHQMAGEPVGGGQLYGSGRMVVAPWAEADPGAVAIKAEGAELPVEALARRYLPGEPAWGMRGVGRGVCVCLFV